jgi:hypothetical protein
MEETYTVKFLTPGQFIIHHNKRFRTPVTFEKVPKKDIQFFETQARNLSLEHKVEKTKIIPIDPLIEELTLKNEDEDIEVEEFSEENKPSTILEKLLDDNET